PFYVVMIGLSPLLLDVLRRRLGWVILVAISAALFIYGGVDPWAFSTPVHHNFPVILWQSVFVAGLLFGANLKRYDALSIGAKRAITAVIVTSFALLFVFHYASDFGWNLPELPLTFTKVPLSLGELLRYFTIFGSLILCIDLAWNRIGQMRFVA